MEKVFSDKDLVNKYTSLMSSAKSRSIEFNLSLRKLKKLCQAKRDFWTGEPITDRSIDRVDPLKGYIDDNVVACNISTNSKRANLTPSEIISMANKLKKMGYK